MTTNLTEYVLVFAAGGLQGRTFRLFKVLCRWRRRRLAGRADCHRCCQRRWCRRKEVCFLLLTLSSTSLFLLTTDTFLPYSPSSILSLLSNASKPLTKVGAPLNLIAIPVGSKRGQSMLPFGVVGNWITSTLKGGSLFVSKFHALYPSVRTPFLRDSCLRSVCSSALIPVLDPHADFPIVPLFCPFSGQSLSLKRRRPTRPCISSGRLWWERRSRSLSRRTPTSSTGSSSSGRRHYFLLNIITSPLLIFFRLATLEPFQSHDDPLLKEALSQVRLLQARKR